MARKIASSFFLLILTCGVILGSPLGENSMDKKICPMKCCKQLAKKKKQVEQKNTVSLCRTLNCNTPSPTNSNNTSQISFGAIFVALKTLPIFQFLQLQKTAEQQNFLFAEAIQLKTTQPKYIQHKAFLI